MNGQWERESWISYSNVHTVTVYKSLVYRELKFNWIFGVNFERYLRCCVIYLCHMTCSHLNQWILYLCVCVCVVYCIGLWKILFNRMGFIFAFRYQADTSEIYLARWFWVKTHLRLVLIRSDQYRSFNRISACFNWPIHLPQFLHVSLIDMQYSMLAHHKSLMLNIKQATNQQYMCNFLGLFSPFCLSQMPVIY